MSRISMRAGMVLLACLALLLVLPWQPAHAQPPVLQPGVMVLGGKRVPLPPGIWRQVGAAEYPDREAPEAAQRPGPRQPPATIRSQVSAFVLEGRVLGLVVARGNLAASERGFGLAAECRRRDLHLARIETPAASPWAACGFIGQVLNATAEGADPAWAAAQAQLQGEGVTMPPVWLAVGFRFADADDLLDVRYLLDPQLLGLPNPQDLALEAGRGLTAEALSWARRQVGLAEPPPPGPWARNGWAAAATAGDPVRTWVIAQLSGWYDDVFAELRRGFKGRGGDIAWPQPWQVAFGLAPPPVAPAPAAPGSGREPASEALWKTISWRTVGSLLDATVALLLTGSASAASAITVVGGLVNATAYYLHELVWASVGTAGAPGQVLTDLPAVGIGG